MKKHSGESTHGNQHHLKKAVSQTKALHGDSGMTGNKQYKRPQKLQTKAKP